MHPSRGVRLSILDDDLDVARTIAFVARREGFEVRVHSVPEEEFLADVAVFDPTFIAVDLVMPAMDGIEVMRSLAATRHLCATHRSRRFDPHAIDPGTIILELTETGAMTSLAEALDVLTRMRIKGFRLAIDDFGTGYSSMVQLARLPFSEIKIDKSFVGAMLSSSEARKIVESTIHLGRSLELQIVAQGVEDAATADLLRDLGCDMAQGYFFARPMDGDATKAWLHRSISVSVG